MLIRNRELLSGGWFAWEVIVPALLSCYSSNKPSNFHDRYVLDLITFAVIVCCSLVLNNCKIGHIGLYPLYYLKSLVVMTPGIPCPKSQNSILCCTCIYIYILWGVVAHW